MDYFRVPVHFQDSHFTILMSDSFSFSDDEESGNQKQDWEQAADQAAEQLKKEQEEQQKEKEEAERMAAE